MKSFIFICFLLFSCISTFSQTNITLIMTPRPAANLSEWSARKETITLIITNMQDNRQVKIKASVKTSDGTQISSTDMNIAPIVSIPHGTSMQNASVVFPLEAQVFTGKYQSSLQRSGKLPSDSYQFCVELDSAANLAPITPTVCKTFFVAGNQLPILMKPYNGEQLEPAKAQTAIIFRWTPVVPRPQNVIYYRIQVFEVLNGQQPVQALRSNQPLLDQTITAQTQYIWQPQLGLIREPADSAGSFTEQSNRFIWTIQTLDEQMQPLPADGNYEGRSEPSEFTIGNKNLPAKQKKTSG